MALQHLTQRWPARVAEKSQASAEVSRAPDGCPELYERQRARWEAFDAEQEPGLSHQQVSTAGVLAASLEQALAALEIPRFACWL